ncbi:MAG: LuxR C-terminal-related transcriptional regulator [Nitrospirota bacterium]|nr:LuxR C-terminal-related transcriptional regulator [Nitrospirota bacterium]
MTQPPFEPDPLAILRKRRQPGLVLIDEQGGLVSANTEASALLQVGESAPGAGDGPLARQTRLTARQVLTGTTGGQCAYAIHEEAGGHFGLRAQLLAPGAPGVQPMVMVLIETVALEREVDFDAVRRRYHTSRREQDVVRLLYYGKGNKEIAELLFISEYTVKDHIKTIMSKMGASSRSEVLYKLVAS